MRAAYFNQYGTPDVLQVGELPDPVLRPGDVLIRVHACGVNPRDWMFRAGTYFARHLVRKWPKIPGSDVSGVVEAVGAEVSRFKVGDEVYAMQAMLGNMGGYAELIRVPVACVARKSEHASHVEAAGAPCAGMTAWQTLKNLAHVQAGQRVLVVGASGGVGHYAVQMAKSLGCEVTAVCSAPNADFVLGLGADRVIDYRQQYFANTVRNQDLVFDTIGMESLASCSPCLQPNGMYVTTVPSPRTAKEAVQSMTLDTIGRAARQSSRVILVKPDGQDLAFLAQQMDAGTLHTAVDSIFPLDEVIDAQKKSRTFRTRGKIVLQIA